MSDMHGLVIRPETPADYADIAAINARAFDFRAMEPALVALLRQRRAYDAALALVAQLHGQVVGNVLFSPVRLRLMDEDVNAVILAPIAVDPPQQGHGVGRALIMEGHRIARSKGYVLSVLVGHPSYYPRFGYQVHAYGGSVLTVHGERLDARQLEWRAPTENDVPALRALWWHEESRVDFGIDPGDEFLEWVSPDPGIEARAYLRGSEIAGFVRIPRSNPLRPKYFLAQDAWTAQAIAYMLLHEAERPGALELPLHPHSASASVLGTARAESWEPAMAYSLGPNPFDRYYAQVQVGGRTPGRVIWPVAFDVAE